MSDFLVSLARRSRFGARFASHKLAMIALCNAASDAGEGVDMPASEIAEAVELADVKSAMRVRAGFVKLGLLEVLEEGGHGRGARGLYRIVVPCLEQLLDGGLDYAAEMEKQKEQRSAKRGASHHPKDHPTKHPDADASLGGVLGGSLGGLAPQTPFSEVSKSLSLPLPPSEDEGERKDDLQLWIREGAEGAPHVERCLTRALVVKIEHHDPQGLVAVIARALKPFSEIALERLGELLPQRRKKIVSLKCVTDLLAEVEAKMCLRDESAGMVHIKISTDPEACAAWVAYGRPFPAGTPQRAIAYMIDTHGGAVVDERLPPNAVAVGNAA